MASEWRAAILAMRQLSMAILASTRRTPAWSSFERADRSVTQDNFCRFIGHNGGEVTKRFCLRRLRSTPARSTGGREING
jgi:hypothetical protein